jgi:exonuclease VII large subunit
MIALDSLPPAVRQAVEDLQAEQGRLEKSLQAQDQTLKVQTQTLQAQERIIHDPERLLKIQAEKIRRFNLKLRGPRAKNFPLTRRCCCWPKPA